MSKRQLVVTKANSLVEATYHLTLAEQRLILLAIAKVDSRAEVNYQISHTITAQEAAKAFHLSESRAYNLLREAAERLYSRSVVIHESIPRASTLTTRWVSAVRYLTQDGAVELFFAQPIIPFISQLKARFCCYHLAYVAQMSSVYAVRLYELLVQWREAGQRTVELDWLRERLALMEKYTNIRDLKRFVLTPAIEQINAHSDLWVKWEQHKRGRVVHALTFSFGAKTVQQADSATVTPTPSKPSKQKQPTLTRAYIAQHAYPGESWEEATERCRRKLEQEVTGSRR